MCAAKRVQFLWFVRKGSSRQAAMHATGVKNVPKTITSSEPAAN
jgi:hypothetical protein